VHGTHTGDFQGILATGKHMTQTGIDILRIVGGKVVERWGEFDNLGLLQQLGAIPSPGQPGGSINTPVRRSSARRLNAGHA